MQGADTQYPLRSSPPASSEAQPDHCRKDVQKVGSQRHSQWHPVSKHRESLPQCMQYPPKRNLGEGSSTWRKEKWGRRESGAFRKQPRRSSEEERRGGWRRRPNSLQPPGRLVHLKGEEVVCVKEQHQVWGRERELKSKGYNDHRESRETLLERPHISSSDLDKADHFGPFHGSNRRRTSRREWSLWIWITWDSRGRGGEERRNKRRARRMRGKCSLDVEGSKPGPTSMAVSWTESHHPGPTSRAVSWGKRGL